MVIQEESKLYFNEKQLHKLLLTKGIYRLQLIFGISSIIFVFSLIYCFVRDILDFNIWYLLILAIDLGIYAMILIPYDEAKNYRFLFYDDRVEYKFDLINFNKHKNFVDSFVVIKNIKHIDISKDKRYAYIYGRIEINFEATTEKAKPYVTEETVVMDKVRVALDFEDGEEILENLKKLEIKSS